MSNKLKLFPPALDANYWLCSHLEGVIAWFDEKDEAGDYDGFGGADVMKDKRTCYFTAGNWAQEQTQAITKELSILHLFFSRVFL